jgi:hypothetical protein
MLQNKNNFAAVDVYNFDQTIHILMKQDNKVIVSANTRTVFWREYLGLRGTK